MTALCFVVKEKRENRYKKVVSNTVVTITVNMRRMSYCLRRLLHEFFFSSSYGIYENDYRTYSINTSSPQEIVIYNVLVLETSFFRAFV